MFDRWGELVFRARFTVIAVMVAALLGLAGYGLSLNDHLSQSGWDDPGSQSSQAARLADGTFGRDTAGDVLVLYTAPEGTTVDDPELAAKVKNSLNTLVANHPNEILKEGQEVKVKLLGFDDRGKVRLGMKMVDQETGEEIAPEKKEEAQAE